MPDARLIQPEKLPGAALSGNQSDVSDGNRDSKPLDAGLAKDSQGIDSDQGVSGSPEVSGRTGNQGEAGYQHEPSVKQGKERGNTRFRNWQRAAYMTFSIDPTFSLGRSSMSFGPLLYLPDYLLMTQSIRLFSASP